MVKDITLGQYYYGDSIIHRLDPRTKFICSIRPRKFTLGENRVELSQDVLIKYSTTYLML